MIDRMEVVMHDDFGDKYYWKVALTFLDDP